MNQVPDPIFATPRLAQVYDTFDGDRDDLIAYLAIVQELRPCLVLDVGCGTGSFAYLLATHGYTVVGVDPAEASLEVARAKDVARSVNWIRGDATTLPALDADLAVMTGNVAQVFRSDDDWLEALRAIRGAVKSGGHLVFETRRPEDRIWEEWATDTGPIVRHLPGIGTVEQRSVVTKVDLPLVSFRITYRFRSDDAVITSDSTLRFRSREEVEQSLLECGYTIREVRDAPDRPGREWVFIAERI